MLRLVFLLFLPSFLMANDIRPKSSVQEVTVFLNGAQVTRSAQVAIPKGGSTVVLEDLSPNVNPNSIQLKGLENTTVSAINFHANYMEKKEESAKIKQLQDQQVGLRKKMAQLRNIIKGLEEEESLLQANKKINNEQENVTVQELTAYSNYYRERIAALGNEVFDTNRLIEEANNKIQDLEKQITKLRSANTSQRGEIVLQIDAPQPISLRLDFSYTVSGAGWYPGYSIKGTDIQEPLALEYKANIYQETGEDWNNVKVTLSTGDPSLQTEKPEMDAHFLSFVNPNRYTPKKTSRNVASYTYNPMIKQVSGVVKDDTGLPVPGVNVVLQGTNRGTQTDFNGKYTIQIENGTELQFSYLGFETQTLPVYAKYMPVSLEPDTNTLDEVVVAGYSKDGLQGKAKGVEIEEEVAVMEKQENLTNVLFKINKPHTIPTSSSDVTTITIDDFEVPATYEYYSAPILVQNVFLTAKISDWEGFDLLPGEADIYFDGSYIGNTYLSPQQLEEELVISLGIDSGIVVEREQIYDTKDKSFFGNTRIVKRNYRTTIRNSKNTAVEVTLLDRIPISQNKEIKVEELDYGNGSFEKEKGIVTWKVNLESKAKEEKQVQYVVKYPKGKFVNLD